MGENEDGPEQAVPDEQLGASEAPEPDTSDTSDAVDEQELSDIAAELDIEPSVIEDEVEPQVVDELPVPTPEGDVDDLATALSAAQGKVAEGESLDDIAPETTHAAPGPEVGLAQVGHSAVPWWPFLCYLGAWVVLTGLAVWQLVQLPVTQVAYESQTYGLMVLGGLIMTAVGPVLILAVWITVWSNRPPQERSGLLTSSLLKGSIVTLGGALLWWTALIIVDYLRLGTPL